MGERMQLGNRADLGSRRWIRMFFHDMMKRDFLQHPKGHKMRLCISDRKFVDANAMIEAQPCVSNLIEFEFDASEWPASQFFVCAYVNTDL
jgi:hypothetical protein